MKTLLKATKTPAETIASGGMTLELSHEVNGGLTLSLAYPAGMQGWPDVWRFPAESQNEATQRFESLKAQYALTQCDCPSVACAAHGLPAGSACGGW